MSSRPWTTRSMALWALAALLGLVAAATDLYVRGAFDGPGPRRDTPARQNALSEGATPEGGTVVDVEVFYEQGAERP